MTMDPRIKAYAYQAFEEEFRMWRTFEIGDRYRGQKMVIVERHDRQSVMVAEISPAMETSYYRDGPMPDASAQQTILAACIEKSIQAALNFGSRDQAERMTAPRRRNRPRPPYNPGYEL